MEQEGCIYLITCLVNGKKYVGQHNKPDPKKRFKKHIWSAENNSSHIIHNAIRLYGKDNFKIEILCICSHAALGNMEAYYAEQYGSYIWDPEPGYNMVWCGRHPTLGLKHSPENIEKMKQAWTKRNPESIEKMKQAILGKKQAPEHIETRRQIHLGRKNTPETIEKMKQAQLGKKLSPESCEKKRQAMLAYYAKKREQAQK